LLPPVYSQKCETQPQHHKQETKPASSQLRQSNPPSHGHDISDTFKVIMRWTTLNGTNGYWQAADSHNPPNTGDDIEEMGG
jgi:hypothetical protein